MKRLLLLLMVAFMGGGVSYGTGVALFGDPGDETGSPLEGEGLLVGDLAQGVTFPPTSAPEPSPTPTATPAPVQAASAPAAPEPQATASPEDAQPSSVSVRSGAVPTPTPDPFAKCEGIDDRRERKDCQNEVKEDLDSQGGKGKQKVECSSDEAQCSLKEK